MKQSFSLVKINLEVYNFYADNEIVGHEKKGQSQNE
jgi:hypothetical protein